MAYAFSGGTHFHQVAKVRLPCVTLPPCSLSSARRNRRPLRTQPSGAAARMRAQMVMCYTLAYIHTPRAQSFPEFRETPLVPSVANSQWEGDDGDHRQLPTACALAVRANPLSRRTQTRRKKPTATRASFHRGRVHRHHSGDPPPRTPHTTDVAESCMCWPRRAAPCPSSVAPPRGPHRRQSQAPAAPSRRPHAALSAVA